MRHLSRGLLLIVATGAGCSAAPSHVPPPWQLPGAAVSSAIGNAIYDARRAKVKRLVTLHERALVAEIDGKGGPHLDTVMDAAGVPVGARIRLSSELRSEPGIYRRDGDPGHLDIEAVTVALMVYGTWKPLQSKGTSRWPNTNCIALPSRAIPTRGR